jgi:hypothetical protein
MVDGKSLKSGKSMMQGKLLLPVLCPKTIDLEGRLVKDAVKTALRDRQTVLADLVHAIREYRKLAESQPLTLQGRLPARCAGVDQSD